VLTNAGAPVSWRNGRKRSWKRNAGLRQADLLRAADVAL
jgi:hypothetical protein